MITSHHHQTVVQNQNTVFRNLCLCLGLEVNSEKTKYMITSRHQNVIQNQNIVIENLSFENVEKSKYLGVTETNTKDIREEIKRRINMGNACYNSLEKILSSRLLSKKLKVNRLSAKD